MRKNLWTQLRAIRNVGKKRLPAYTSLHFTSAAASRVLLRLSEIVLLLDEEKR